MNFLLSIEPNVKLGFIDALGFGGQTVLLGMLTIFSVLVIIWLCLIGLKFFLHDMPSKKKTAEKVISTASTPEAAPVPPSNDEIIVAIAAAIAAAESESSGMKFKVVSFRRR